MPGQHQQSQQQLGNLAAMPSPPSVSPLSFRQDDHASQQHSTKRQTCQNQSPGSDPFGFPLRVIPPGHEKHPGPRAPLEAYEEARRWVEWDLNPHAGGVWFSHWLKLPTPDDVSLLVEEIVLRGILPKCFLKNGAPEGPGGGGSQGAPRAQIEAFTSGAHNDLFTLRCQCCPTSQEGQAAEASPSELAILQPSSRVRSRRPVYISNSDVSSGHSSTLLHHGGGGVGDKSNISHIPTEILLRLSLPLDPYFHMESEVATAHFARIRGVPVPRIYAYDSSAVNCLGIEWQLVEKVPDPDTHFVGDILDEEEEALRKKYGSNRDTGGGRSAAWTKLGHQLEKTLALLRSGVSHPHQARPSTTCFDEIGSLYWDFEKRDFVLGPVSDSCFTRGRRILYHQRNDGDGGDPRLPLLRGPFRSVSEYVSSALTMSLWESNDETLRFDSPASSEADSTTAVIDMGFSSEEDDDPPRSWYTEADAEAVQDQVSKLRDIVMPWLVDKLTPEQQGRMRTYIYHPDLHSSNLLVSRRAQAQPDGEVDGDGDGDGAGVNVLEEEYEISAILDWEHTVALPDYLINPVDVSSYFTDALPTTKYRAFGSTAQIKRYLDEALGGGDDTARSPWRTTAGVSGLSAPDGLLPWRSGGDSGGDPSAARATGGGDIDVDGAGGQDPGVEGRGEVAAVRWLMTPPRDLTNAEALLYLVFERLDCPIGRWSESWVNPLAERIQGLIESEGKT